MYRKHTMTTKNMKNRKKENKNIKKQNTTNMNHFIKNIHINNLLHLKNFDIPIADEKAPHLMLTGKNGSGKTILLNAIADFLDKIKNDINYEYINIENFSESFNKKIESLFDYKSEVDPNTVNTLLDNFKRYENRVKEMNKKVYLTPKEALKQITEEYQKEDFIIVFYQAARMPAMQEIDSPTKPNYNVKGDVRNTVTDQFLNFLSDLKIQEALARIENPQDDANEISKWFINFENILQLIFKDKNLKLTFNYKDYSFKILSEGKEFKFTELSDGYAAILDIVVDLILKMQSKNHLTRAYNKKGIVLIDEVETHLHLELQKMIMPILTNVFPNIQFIITTHSPFVLSSLDNAVAFDLEHREIINDLTQYSYEALAEGYFGVSSESSYMEMQLEKLKSLLDKKTLSVSDKYDIKQLVANLDKVSESVSPNLVGTYLTIKNKYTSVLKAVLK